MHQVHCEIILKIASGSRMNPRIPSCFNDEGFIGLVTHAARRAPHAKTLAKTLLQA